MPPFERPADFAYDPDTEIEALRTYRATKPGRNIPQRSDDTLLLASWNIANLGDPGQPRDPQDYKVMAELISWFDIVAVQEVKQDIGAMRQLLAELPPSYDAVLTDTGGNNERLVYLYDSAKVERLELAGEIAVPPKDQRYVRLPGIEQKFRGFDRNPYAVGFRVAGMEVTIANAHLYFGSSSTRSENRRALETYALGRWADLNRKSRHAYTRNVIVIGDLNMPKKEKGDKIYDALTKRGLHLPRHTTRVGSTTGGKTHYDQLAFFPGQAGRSFVASGVFDFDGAVFADLWPADLPEGATTAQRAAYKDEVSYFKAFVKYHISDHRLLWARFNPAQITD